MPLLSRVQEHGGEQIIPFSCALERNLADMPPDEAAKYCEENKVQRSVLRICLTAIERIRVKSLCKYFMVLEKELLWIYFYSISVFQTKESSIYIEIFILYI